MSLNTSCETGAAAFICWSAFEILLCATMLKRFPHIESFHTVSGNDTRTVQWAIAAAAGTTAERRRPEATRKELEIGNTPSSERHLHRTKKMRHREMVDRYRNTKSVPLGFHQFFLEFPKSV